MLDAKRIKQANVSEKKTLLLFLPISLSRTKRNITLYKRDTSSQFNNDYLILLCIVEKKLMQGRDLTMEEETVSRIVSSSDITIPCIRITRF